MQKIKIFSKQKITSKFHTTWRNLLYRHFAALQLHPVGFRVLTPLKFACCGFEFMSARVHCGAGNKEMCGNLI